MTQDQNTTGSAVARAVDYGRTGLSNDDVVHDSPAELDLVLVRTRYLPAAIERAQADIGTSRSRS